jgi:hypothetical protein
MAMLNNQMVDLRWGILSSKNQDWLVATGTMEI